MPDRTNYPWWRVLLHAVVLNWRVARGRCQTCGAKHENLQVELETHGFLEFGRHDG